MFRKITRAAVVGAAALALTLPFAPAHAGKANPVVSATCTYLEGNVVEVRVTASDIRVAAIDTVSVTTYSTDLSGGTILRGPLNVTTSETLGRTLSFWTIRVGVNEPSTYTFVDAAVRAGRTLYKSGFPVYSCAA